MSAVDIAHALGGHKAGVGWMARCPAHDDLRPSLSIRDADDNNVLLHCHAGCGQAQVIEALRDRWLWEKGGPQLAHSISRAGTNKPPDLDEPKRTSAAVALWQAATVAVGTIVETYLAFRGLHLQLPPTLRFHGGLKHVSGGIWPVMMALVTRGSDDAPMAIHRTYLARNGGAKAPVDPEKMMLGPCRGGAVRLGRVQADQWLIVAEGIETTLSVMEASALPGWAALSAGGIRNLILPPEAAMVLICADNDANGTGLRAAEEAAERFLREGRRVRIAAPPMPGTDFNDVLTQVIPSQAREETRHVA
jgi:putative DNA primase/helicase